MRVADQAFWVGQKQKGKVGPSAGKPKSAYVAQPKKEDKDEKKQENKKCFASTVSQQIMS